MDIDMTKGTSFRAKAPDSQTQIVRQSSMNRAVDMFKVRAQSKMNSVPASAELTASQWGDLMLTLFQDAERIEQWVIRKK